MAPIREKFAKFVSEQTATSLTALDPARKAELFDQYLKWPQNPIALKVTMRLTSENGTGQALGTVTAMNTEISVGGRKESGLLLKPDLKGLRPGYYAFHVHENPNCGPDIKDGKAVPGLAAGGHLWLTGTGRFAGIRFGNHLGDLPDLEVDAGGASTRELIAPRLTLADIANRALMIHASQDDTSGRMACGALK